MSLASAYAAAVATVTATLPAPWTGPDGLMVASVDSNGNCVLNFGGNAYPVPPAAMTSFVTWFNTTFT